MVSLTDLLQADPLQWDNCWRERLADQLQVEYRYLNRHGEDALPRLTLRVFQSLHLLADAQAGKRKRYIDAMARNVRVDCWRFENPGYHRDVLVVTDTEDSYYLKDVHDKSKLLVDEWLQAQAFFDFAATAPEIPERVRQGAKIMEVQFTAGLDLFEAADVLGLHQGTCRAWLHHARLHYRRWLQDEFL